MSEGHGFVGGGFMWLFWIVLIVIAVWAVSAVTGGGRSHRVDESPVDILKARYARGEIDREEFEQKKRDIT